MHRYYISCILYNINTYTIYACTFFYISGTCKDKVWIIERSGIRGPFYWSFLKPFDNGLGEMVRVTSHHSMPSLNHPFQSFSTSVLGPTA